MLKAKTKRSIARAVFALTMLFLIGIIGGVERGASDIKEAIIYLVPGAILMIVAGAKGGLYRL